MPEDTSLQISDNIQKLFDISSRFDERVKGLKSKHEVLDKRLEDINEQQVEVFKKIAVLEDRHFNSLDRQQQVNDLREFLIDLDKRLAKLENETGIHNQRWKDIAAFIVQLIWVILAAYLLTKLNLQAPAVP